MISKNTIYTSNLTKTIISFIFFIILIYTFERNLDLTNFLIKLLYFLMIFICQAKLQLVKAKKRSLSSSFRMRNRDSLDAKSKISSPSLKPQEHETTKEEQEKNTSATKSPPKIKPMLLTEAGRRRISMQSVESKNSSTSEDTSSAGDLSANGTLRSIRGIEKKQEFCYGGFRNSSLRKSQSMKLSKKPAFVVNNLSSNRASQANRRSIGSIGVLVKSPLHSPSGSLDHRPPISASNSFSRLEKAPSSELDQDDDQENEAWVKILDKVIVNFITLIFPYCSKVKLTIDELISTEKDYVKSLNYVIQVLTVLFWLKIKIYWLLNFL